MTKINKERGINMSQEAVIQFFDVIVENSNVKEQINNLFITSGSEKLRLLGLKNGYEFPQKINVSDEIVVQFLNAYSQDKDIQAQINSILVSENPEAIVEIARNNGYNFTAAELKAIMDKNMEQLEYELSERDLDAVAGGWTQASWGQGKSIN